MVLIILMVFGFGLSTQLFDTVDSREYHVRQAAITGDISVHSEPGVYAKLFGARVKYPRTMTFYFSSESLDGGDGADAKPLSSTFMGNSEADVSGMIMIELPLDEQSRITLHRKYGSVEAIKMNLLRNAVSAALKQTGPMFRPEEAFVTRRPEFTRLMRDILTDGIYETETTVDVIAEQGKEIRLDRSILKLDTNGKRTLLTKSSLSEYNIRIADFVIKDFDFDKATTELIHEKKKSQQKIVTARADAEKAKQDALTAVEQGKAKVAIAEAEALVVKKTAVVNAEREAAVAQQREIQAKFEAAAMLATKKAEADANALKVKAGLTPQERAEYEMNTKVGVAKALATWKGPQVVMSGSSDNSGSGMLEALAIKQMMGIAEQLDK